MLLPKYSSLLAPLERFLPPPHYIRYRPWPGGCSTTLVPAQLLDSPRRAVQLVMRVKTETCLRSSCCSRRRSTKLSIARFFGAILSRRPDSLVEQVTSKRRSQGSSSPARRSGVSPLQPLQSVWRHRRRNVDGTACGAGSRSRESHQTEEDRRNRKISEALENRMTCQASSLGAVGKR